MSSAPEVCRIYVVRHGTTTLNVENRYRGRLDVDLDEQGWRDAHAAAEQLRDKGIAAVYSSPLRRARDTARTIAAAASAGDVIDLDGLINLDYGRWDALTPAEASAADPIAYARYQAFEPGATCPDGENLDAAAARVVKALRLIGQRHPGQSVVAVSHAAMVRLALVNITGGPRAEWRRKLPNGSITVVETDGPSLRTPELLDESAG